MMNETTFVGLDVHTHSIKAIALSSSEKESWLLRVRRPRESIVGTGL